METTNLPDNMDPALPLASTETLRPLVQLFLDKLTVVQWVKLESGSLDKDTENVITDICLDIINIVSKYIYEAVKQRLTERSDLNLTQSPLKSSRSSSSSSGSQKSFTISEDQVQECLGDTISRTFAKVMGVPQDTRCQSIQEVTDIVVEEVTERVNSELSKRGGSSGGSSEGVEPLVSKTSTRRLRAMAKHVVKILQRCAEKMIRTSGSSNAHTDQQSPKVQADADETASVESTEQDEEPVETGESCQTPVTPLHEDGQKKVSSGESFVDTTTEAIRQILEEQMDDFTSIEYNDDISVEEYDLLVFSNSQDIDEAASKIVRVILEGLNLESDGTPKVISTSEAKSSKASCWQKVGSKVKAFFMHKFAKEAIFSFVAKLRSKLDCFPQKKDQLSTKQLIEGVDCLVEDMIPPEEDQEWMGSTAQVCLYERIARDISRGQHEVTAKQLCDIVYHHLKLGKTLKVHCMVQIRTEVDLFMKLMWNWLNQQAQKHRTKRDRVTAAIKQIEGVVVNLPVSTASPSEQENDTLTLVSEAAPASRTEEPVISDEALITDEPVIGDEVDEAASEPTAHPVNKWDKLCCVITVSGLVNRIRKNLYINPSSEAVKTTITTLSEMLCTEIAGSDIAVKPSGRHIKKTVKAVHNDLCKKTLGAEVLGMSLLSQDPLIYDCIIQTLKRHLVTPQKESCVTRFLKNTYRVMAKPFTACFK